MNVSSQLHVDFSKTILRWSFDTIDNPLVVNMSLPKREQNTPRFYQNFLPLILEEARAGIASGLQLADEFFSLSLRQAGKFPGTEDNPLSLTFVGDIPKEIEHGPLVLLLKSEGMNLLALASKNDNTIDAKIIISKTDYDNHRSCFTKRALWGAKFLSSPVSEQRMYEACLEASQSSSETPCIRGIARGEISEPRKTPTNVLENKDLHLLNLSQRNAIDAFLNASEGSTVLLEGPPGTGKTSTVVALLKILARGVKRTMVSAHSNKAVAVLAKRASKDLSDVPMIIIGVESKMDNELKPISFKGWYDTVNSHILACREEIKSLAEDPATNVSMTKPALLAELREHIMKAEFLLVKFSLIDNPELSVQTREALNKLTNPLLIGDFQNVYSYVTQTARQLQSKPLWIALSESLVWLGFKWTRLRRTQLENHLLNHARIVFSTLITAGRNTFTKMEPIDYLIVDEAAQSVEAATLIPLRFQPRKVLLIGDTKQLPATVISPVLKDKSYGWSMMWRLINECKQPCLSLTIQYRMHPSICQWPSSQFYSNELVTAPDILPCKLANTTNITSRPYAFYKTSGKEKLKGTSFCNHQEANYVAKIIMQIRRDPEKHTIGVVTPYAEQKRVIREKLPKDLSDSVHTVDGFQGDEKDIIIMSLTKTRVSRFLVEFRRLNVALTRPKKCLIILGAPSLQGNDLVGQLMDDAQRRRVLHSEQDLKIILMTGKVPSSEAVLEPNLLSSALQGHARSQFNYAQSIIETNSSAAWIWYRRAAENGDTEAQYYTSRFYSLSDPQLSRKWLEKAAEKVPLAQFALGQELLANNEIAKGIQWYERAVAGNLIPAMVALASCYAEGRHVPKDIPKARIYYRKAAVMNDWDSILKLAPLLASGTLANKSEAAEWYKKAANEKLSPAYFPLAVLLDHDFDDQVGALTWYNRASERGNAEASFELGLRFQHGNHCPIDLTLAMRYFKRAAAAGHTQAEFAYAVALRDGCGIQQDTVKALKYFQKAADKGNAEALYQVATQTSLKQQSYQCFKKAALQHHALSQLECVYYQVAFDCDLNLCLAFCEALVRVGSNREIEFVLARLLDTGIGGKKDQLRAARLYSKLAESSHVPSQYHLAIVLEQGTIVPQDLIKACTYYNMCIEQYFFARLRLACLMLKKAHSEQKTEGVNDVQTPLITQSANVNENTNSAQTNDQAYAIELLEFYENHYSNNPIPPETPEQHVEQLVRKHIADSVVPFVTTSVVEANYLLGRIFETGKGVPVDLERALQYYRLASAEHVDACYRVGLFYETGRGVVQSSSTAQKFYQKASKQGHMLASDGIERLVKNDHSTIGCCMASCVVS